jgi:hypothetical protein
MSAVSPEPYFLPQSRYQDMPPPLPHKLYLPVLEAFGISVHQVDVCRTIAILDPPINRGGISMPRKAAVVGHLGSDRDVSTIKIQHRRAAPDTPTRCERILVTDKEQVGARIIQ